MELLKTLFTKIPTSTIDGRGFCISFCSKAKFRSVSGATKMLDYMMKEHNAAPSRSKVKSGDISFVELEVENNGFTFALCQPGGDDPIRITGHLSMFKPFVTLQVFHPDLDVYDYPKYVHVPVPAFYEMVSLVSLRDGKFLGSFRLNTDPLDARAFGYYDSNITFVFPVSNIKIDSLSSSISVGQIKSERRRTSKWVPGRVYLSNITNTCYLFLGYYKGNFWRTAKQMGKSEVYVFSDSNFLDSLYYSFDPGSSSSSTDLDRIVLRISESDVDKWSSYDSPQDIIHSLFDAISTKGFHFSPLKLVKFNKLGWEWKEVISGLPKDLDLTNCLRDHVKKYFLDKPVTGYLYYGTSFLSKDELEDYFTIRIDDLVKNLSPFIRNSSTRTCKNVEELLKTQYFARCIKRVFSSIFKKNPGNVGVLLTKILNNIKS